MSRRSTRIGPDRSRGGRAGSVRRWVDRAHSDRQPCYDPRAGRTPCSKPVLTLSSWKHAGSIKRSRDLKFWAGLTAQPSSACFDWPDPIAAATRQLAEAGAAVIGANCFGDLTLADRFLDAMATMDQMPCWLKPSGGLPGDFVTLARRVARWPTRSCSVDVVGQPESHLAAIHAAWSSD